MIKLFLYSCITMSIMLRLDDRSSGSGFVDYFNYICIAGLAVMAVLCFVHRKRIIRGSVENGLRAQWSCILLAACWILLLILAIMDIFIGT